MKRSVTQTSVKDFFLRGLAFGGFGPVIAGFIYLCLNYSLENFTLNGVEVFIAIISTYILAFVNAGSGIFHQIESWSPAKAALCQLSLLYVTYVLCYLINSWIPFDPMTIVLFTVIFVVGYGVIYLTVHLSVKAAAKRLNRSLE